MFLFYSGCFLPRRGFFPYHPWPLVPPVIIPPHGGGVSYWLVPFSSGTANLPNALDWVFGFSFPLHPDQRKAPAWLSVSLY